MKTNASVAARLGFKNLASNETKPAQLTALVDAARSARGLVIERSGPSEIEQRADDFVRKDGKTELEVVATPFVLAAGMALSVLERLVRPHGSNDGQLNAQEVDEIIAGTVDRTTGLDRLVMIHFLTSDYVVPQSFIGTVDAKSKRRFDPLKAELTVLPKDQQVIVGLLAESVSLALGVPVDTDRERLRASIRSDTAFDAEAYGLSPDVVEPIVEYGMATHAALGARARADAIYG